jgi:hypothetical protein
MNSKKLTILIALSGVVLIILMIGYLVLSNSSEDTTQAPVSPTPSLLPTEEPPGGLTAQQTSQIIRQANPGTVEDIPVTPDVGVDTENPIMEESIKSISDLSSSLPYEHTLGTSSGIETYNVINDSEYQETTWTLQILVQGVDYRIPEHHPDYEKNRTAFLESAAHVLQWIQKQDVNPDSIIIKWNQRLVEQERSQEWLSSV